VPRLRWALSAGVGIDHEKDESMTQTNQSGLTLPSSDELASLPTRPRIAFAARCARRALSLLTERFGQAAGEAVGVLDSVVKAVEDAGGGADAEISLEDARDLAMRVCLNAQDQMAESLTGESPPVYAYTADCADVAVYAIKTAITEDAKASAKHACNAALQSRQVAGTSADGGEDLTRWAAALHATRNDFDRLFTDSERLGWVGSTCIKPEWFGDL